MSYSSKGVTESTKFRYFELIIYKENILDFNSFVSFISDCNFSKALLSPLHNPNNDRNSNGSKKLHYHLIVNCMGMQVSAGDIISLFQEYNVTLFNISRIRCSWSCAVEYLIHKGKEDKEQLNKDDVICFNCDYDSECNSDEKEDKDKLYKDIIDYLKNNNFSSLSDFVYSVNNPKWLPIIARCSYFFNILISENKISYIKKKNEINSIKSSDFLDKLVN